MTNNKNNPVIRFTKEELLSTGDWIDYGLNGVRQLFIWKHIDPEIAISCELLIYFDDGHTKLTEYDNDDDFQRPLFEGYIETLEDLQQIIKLCKLHRA